MADKTKDKAPKETKAVKPAEKKPEIPADRGRSTSKAPKIDGEVLLKVLWLLPSLVWTSYSSQALVKPLVGTNFASMFFHFATFVSVCLFTFLSNENPKSQKRMLEVSSALQVVSAFFSRFIVTKTLEYVDDPFWAAVIVHVFLGLPAIGTAGSVWLSWMNKFAEIEDEPTAGGRLVFKVFTSIALSSIISFTESFLGKTLLNFVEIPPSTALAVLALSTFLLSGTTESNSIKPSTETLSRAAIFATFLVAAFAAVLPPYIPKELKILSQRFTPNGLVQVADSYVDPLPIRYLRHDAGMIGANVLNENGVLGDTMNPSAVLQDAARLSKDLRGKRALVFGIGTGYNVKTLVEGGWNTTAVEKERAIYDAARSYFSMPEPQQLHIDDAYNFVWDEAIRANRTKDFEKYDIILHDVLTEGALQASLFTMEFFQEIRTILDDHGVLAVTYWGKPRSITMKSTVNILLNSFGSCRVFHDSTLPESPLQPFRSDDFASIVIFCTPLKILNLRSYKLSDYKDSPLREGIFTTLKDRELDINDILDGTPRDVYLLRTRDPKMQSWGTEYIKEFWQKMRKDYDPSIWSSY